MTIHARSGDVTLRLIKPCSRCPIPTIDQTTGAPDPRWPGEPLDTMRAYRANPRLDGALTFGQNAIISDAGDTQLEVGQEIDMALDFGD
ncbi:MOSC domain-containing protein (plasmid) [Mycetohabitans rhizoxinica]